MLLPQPNRHLRASGVSTVVRVSCAVVLAHLLVLTSIPIDRAQPRVSAAPLNIRVLPAPTQTTASPPAAPAAIRHVPPDRHSAPPPASRAAPRPTALPSTPSANASDTPTPLAPTHTPAANSDTLAASSSTASMATGPRPAPVVDEVLPPSSKADYLDNPQPSYPAISRRLGEQGRVVVRVLIGADGLAKQASIAQSSGFPRLDQTALQTVLRWRFVPGRRAGVAEAMWHQVPISFTLE